MLIKCWIILLCNLAGHWHNPFIHFRLIGRYRAMRYNCSNRCYLHHFTLNPTAEGWTPQLWHQPCFGKNNPTQANPKPQGHPSDEASIIHVLILWGDDELPNGSSGKTKSILGLFSSLIGLLTNTGHVTSYFQSLSVCEDGAGYAKALLILKSILGVSTLDLFPASTKHMNISYFHDVDRWGTWKSKQENT